MTNKIVFAFDEGCDMMEITKGHEIIFFGNYWDFPNDPRELAKLLSKLGYEIEVQEREIDV